jgi:hypothetical protein
MGFVLAILLAIRKIGSLFTLVRAIRCRYLLSKVFGPRVAFVSALVMHATSIDEVPLDQRKALSSGRRSRQAGQYRGISLRAPAFATRRRNDRKWVNS